MILKNILICNTNVISTRLSFYRRFTSYFIIRSSNGTVAIVITGLLTGLLKEVGGLTELHLELEVIGTDLNIVYDGLVTGDADLGEAVEVMEVTEVVVVIVVTVAVF
jgi:hypothetical protein